MKKRRRRSEDDEEFVWPWSDGIDFERDSDDEVLEEVRNAQF